MQWVSEKSTAILKVWISAKTLSIMLMPTENEWYADSFCYDDDGVYYLFVEIMGRNGGRGTLGVTSFTPGGIFFGG